MTLFLLLGSERYSKEKIKFWLDQCKCLSGQAVLLPGEKEGGVHLMKCSTGRQQTLL